MNRINPYKQFVGIFIPNWLLESDICSLNAKVTYGILAYHAGENGECYPSQKVIADKIGVSTRSVRNYIDELEKVDLIEVEQQGLKRNNRYYFLEHEIMDRKSGSTPERNVASTPDRKEASTPKVREQKKENNSNINYVGFVDFWNEVNDCNLRVTNKKREMIRARLRSYSEDELKTAIENRSRNAWINGDGKKYKTDWKSFWRNDEKVESYLHQSKEDEVKQSNGVMWGAFGD